MADNALTLNDLPQPLQSKVQHICAELAERYEATDLPIKSTRAIVSYSTVNDKALFALCTHRPYDYEQVLIDAFQPEPEAKEHIEKEFHKLWITPADGTLRLVLIVLDHAELFTLRLRVCLNNKKELPS